VLVPDFLHGFGLSFARGRGNFKLGGCVGSHEMSISYANMLSI
jgi:hypothetical protein